MTVHDDCNKSNSEAIDEAAVLVDLRETMHGSCDSRAAMRGMVSMREGDAFLDPLGEMLI
jgi:hypothetical protein